MHVMQMQKPCCLWDFSLPFPFLPLSPPPHFVLQSLAASLTVSECVTELTEPACFAPTGKCWGSGWEGGVKDS